VIRDTRFLISRKPYAVDLSSLRMDEPRASHDGSLYARATLDAVWFRRRSGVTVACIGQLWDHQAPPVDAAQFLAQHADGRYGGNCHGRWDGTGYWGEQVPDVIEEHLALLRPMLANYPTIPAGYDGWWHF
jgi:hypothetical protein